MSDSSTTQQQQQQQQQNMSALAPSPPSPTALAALSASALGARPSACTSATPATASTSVQTLYRSAGKASKVARSRDEWFEQIMQRQAPLLAQDGRRATCSATGAEAGSMMPRRRAPMSMKQQHASMLSVQAKKIGENVRKGATISAAAWASSSAYGAAAAPDPNVNRRASSAMGLQNHYKGKISKAASKSMTYSTNSKSIRSRMTSVRESRSSATSEAQQQASRAEYESLQAELTNEAAVQADSSDEDEEDQVGMEKLEEEAMHITGQRLSQVVDNPEALNALIGQGIGRLKVEPASEEGCKAMFDMYEAFAETVTTSRQALLAFWNGARDEFHDGALTAMEKLMVAIDKEENLGLYEEQRTNYWFVYLMASKVMVNCKTIDGLIRTLQLKLEQMASQDQCPICLESFEDIANDEGNDDMTNGGATDLGCCHKVCTDCWDHWRVIGGFCPLCRHEEFAVRLGFNY